MVKGVLSQSDLKILKSVMCYEQLGQSTWFFACWDRLKEGKRWFENFQFAVVKSALRQSDCRIF